MQNNKDEFRIQLPTDYKYSTCNNNDSIANESNKMEDKMYK